MVASSLLIGVGLFVAAPPLLTPLVDPSGIRGQHDLGTAVDRGFTAFWANGGHLDGTLRAAIRYWSTYHLLKCLFAAMVVASAGAFASVLVVRVRTSGRRLFAGLWAGAAVSAVGVGGFFSLLVIANIQGPVAPIASLLPTLTMSTDRGSTRLVDEAHRLVTGSRPSEFPPPLERMVRDFSRFHLVLAVLATVLAALALGAAITVWRRSSGTAGTAGTDRQTRVTLRTIALAVAVGATGVVVIAAANVATAAAPIRGFADALTGGF